MSTLDIPSLNERFEHARTEEILQWAWETFGPKVALSSSFQTQSIPLLHLVSHICPQLPIIFLDTGFHFPTTLTFRDELQARLGLNIKIIHPAIEKHQLIARYGQGLYRHDPDLCCYINKVEPMQKVISGFAGWISGVRRDQTTTRQALSVLAPQSKGLLKIHPMLNWTKKDIWAYIDQYQLPNHPLFAQGYMSVGCAPCTRPIFAGQDERAGRWVGKNKLECGLHLTLPRKESEHVSEE